MTVALATVVHDPHEKLLPKWRTVLPALVDVFDAVAVRATPLAPASILSLLDEHGVHVLHDTGPTGEDTIGRGRRLALEAALETGCDHIVYSDADHAMRWVERVREDAVAALAELDAADFTVFGRPPDVFALAPAPLRETEGLCNAFYERLTGRRWDLFIAMRGMTSACARLIVEDCDEDTIATDVAWPLFVESRGCSLAYREVPVPYETSTEYALGRSEHAQIEADPTAWSMRSRFAAQMFDAFARWGPSA